MPRLSETLFKSGGARNPNVNFKKFQNYTKSFADNKIRQFNVLGNRVSLRKYDDDHGGCREEMLMLMTCWKKHGFQENVCNEEYKKFSKCTATIRAKVLHSKKLQSSGSKLGVDTNNTSNPHVTNKLLQMFPQPPFKRVITHSYGRKMGEPLVYTQKGESNTQNDISKTLFRPRTKQNRT